MITVVKKRHTVFLCHSVDRIGIKIKNQVDNYLSDYHVAISGGQQVFQYTESGVAPTIVDTVTPTNFRHTTSPLNQ